VFQGSRVVPPPLTGAASSAGIPLPDLRLHPRVLHLNVEDPSGKTEAVHGYEPNGSYHDTCEGLGIATIEQGRTKKHTTDFDVAPTHEGRCIIQFLHTENTKIEEKTLTVIVH
jgi:hypothetical protein